jgi:hypothetical protein
MCCHCLILSVHCQLNDAPQLVQEFKVLLHIGRRMVFPVQSNAAVHTDVTTQIQFRAADGSNVARTVSLMFPAKSRTVVRLMEAWYDAQVGVCCVLLLQSHVTWFETKALSPLQAD